MNSLIVQDTKDGAILTVYVQPNVSTTECVGIHGDALKIRVAAPPVDGAANEELLRVLVKLFNVPRAAIDLISGATNKNKVVRVRGISLDEAARKISAAL